MDKKNINIIGYDSGWGCLNFGCEDGPDNLSIDKIRLKLKEQGIEVEWNGSLGLKSLASHDKITTKEGALPFVVKGLEELAHKIYETTKENKIPVVIGGDHSSAIGTWSGITTALDTCQKFGMIWLDAHMDAHTPDTADEGKWGGWWHGMPVASLIGSGLPEFTNLISSTPKLSADHVSLIGIRSYEHGEDEFLKGNNIRVYLMDEVYERGFNDIFKVALERATTGTDGFGISIDLDAFDPKDAPGVGTQEKDGLRSAEVLPVISGLAYHPLFKGIEIAEYNPHNDRDKKTLHLIENIIFSLFSTSSD